MSGSLRELSVLVQEPVVIGKLGEKTIAVYPPSISRWGEILKLVETTDSKIIEAREKFLNATKEPKIMGKAELADLQKTAEMIFADQREKIAPLICAMTAKPGADYKWEPVLIDAEVINLMPATVCLQIIDTYLQVSAVPDVLKKMQTLAR